MHLFSKLPLDIILYEILPYDKHFKIRKGKLVSVIPKDDERYVICQYITRTLNHSYIIGNMHRRYEFYLHKNKYDFVERRNQNIEDDYIEMTMCYNEDASIEYSIIISKLVPRTRLYGCNNYKNIIFLCNVDNYCWTYQTIRYLR
jgi:hypothetical protein